VSPSAPLEETAQLMRDHKIGGLPVVEEGNVVGMVTEVDILGVLLRALGGGELGTRMEIEVEDRPGALAEIASIIKDHGINSISGVTAAHAEVGKRQLVIRLNTSSPDPLVTAVAQAGVNVLSITVR